ncbi:MAG: hypothetical protein PVH19_02460 [Planctomycetia bacterium]|jgi:hypothetical protein
MKFIKKLIATGFVYFAIATLTAQMILFCYFWFGWGLTWKKAQDATAVLQGNATIEPVITPENVADAIPEEQPSFEEILEARALKIRDFELRGQALSQGKATLRQRQETLAKDTATFNLAKTSFEQQAAAFKALTQSEGIEQNIAMLQGLDVNIAKVELLKMYNETDMPSLIAILEGMELRKCTAILNTFTTKDDYEKLAEILRRIRDGFEFKPPVETTAENPPPQM